MKQPKYRFGQKVKTKLTAEVKGFNISQEVIGEVSVIRVNSSDTEQYYEYGITKSMPQAYYGGSPPFAYIPEEQIETA